MTVRSHVVVVVVIVCCVEAVVDPPPPPPLPYREMSRVKSHMDFRLFFWSELFLLSFLLQSTKILCNGVILTNILLVTIETTGCLLNL